MFFAFVIPVVAHLTDCAPNPFVLRAKAGTIVRFLAVEDRNGRFWAPGGGPLAPGVRDNIIEADGFGGEISSSDPQPSSRFAIYYTLTKLPGAADIKADFKAIGDDVDFCMPSSGICVKTGRGPAIERGYCEVAGGEAKSAWFNMVVSEGRYKTVSKSVRSGHSFRPAFGQDLTPRFKSFKNGDMELALKEMGWRQDAKELKCRVPRFDSAAFAGRIRVSDRQGAVIYEQNFDPLINPAPKELSVPFDLRRSHGAAKDAYRVEFQVRPSTVFSVRSIRLAPALEGRGYPSGLAFAKDPQTHFALAPTG